MSDRRPRGYLALDINLLLQQVASGEVEIEDGVNLTPSALANLLVEVDGLDKEDKPSPGAVSAILKRWERIGYIEVLEGPYRFVKITEDGLKLGIEHLEERFATNGGKHTPPPVDPERRVKRAANKVKRYMEMVEANEYLDAVAKPVQVESNFFDDL